MDSSMQAPHGMDQSYGAARLFQRTQSAAPSAEATYSTNAYDPTGLHDNSGPNMPLLPSQGAPQLAPHNGNGDRGKHYAFGATNLPPHVTQGQPLEYSILPPQHEIHYPHQTSRNPRHDFNNQSQLPRYVPYAGLAHEQYGHVDRYAQPGSSSQYANSGLISSQIAQLHGMRQDADDFLAQGPAGRDSGFAGGFRASQTNGSSSIYNLDRATSRGSASLDSSPSTLNFTHETPETMREEASKKSMRGSSSAQLRGIDKGTAKTVASSQYPAHDFEAATQGDNPAESDAATSPDQAAQKTVSPSTAQQSRAVITSTLTHAQIVSDPNFQWRFASADEARSSEFRRIPLKALAADDVDSVENNARSYVQRIMIALTQTGWRDPEAQQRKGQRLTDDEKAEFTRWQSDAGDALNDVLAVLPQAWFIPQVEAKAWMIFDEIIKVHKLGCRPGTDLDSKSICSERMSKAIVAIESFTLVREDIFKGFDVQKFAAHPENYGEHKVNYLWSNKKSKAKNGNAEVHKGRDSSFDGSLHKSFWSQDELKQLKKGTDPSNLNTAQPQPPAPKKCSSKSSEDAKAGEASRTSSKRKRPSDASSESSAPKRTKTAPPTAPADQLPPPPEDAMAAENTKTAATDLQTDSGNGDTSPASREEAEVEDAVTGDSGVVADGAAMLQDEEGGGAGHSDFSMPNGHTADFPSSNPPSRTDHQHTGGRRSVGIAKANGRAEGFEVPMPNTDIRNFFFTNAAAGTIHQHTAGQHSKGRQKHAKMHAIHGDEFDDLINWDA